jgi:hypothetical protein
MSTDSRNVIAQRAVDARCAERALDAWPDVEITEPYIESCGAPCFSNRIHRTPVPRNFKLNSAQAKYDGTAHQDTWLDDYLVAIQYAGGDKSTAMLYLQLQLTGSARAWLKSLPAESIRSWDDLVCIFTANFQGTFE